MNLLFFCVHVRVCGGGAHGGGNNMYFMYSDDDESCEREIVCQEIEKLFTYISIFQLHI
jgi:hypothetical protein